MQNQTVVIVGGTGGIGLETARRYSSQGAAVAVLGKSTDEAVMARDTLQSIATDPQHVLAMAGDATDRQTVEVFFENTMIQFGRVDILVHVAGVSGRRFGDGPLHACTDEGWDVVMNTNVRSVFLSNQCALKIMKEQQKGVIVNVSSILGMVGEQEYFTTHAYAASKGAILSMSRSAAVFYAKDNIRVNVVCPGLLNTPMSQRAVNDPAIREALNFYQPLAPHIGYPSDIASAICFLASDDAKFITGVALPVDGGWTAQ